QPDVVRDLRQRDRDDLHRGRGLDEPVPRRLGLERIGRREDREARLLAQACANTLGELRMRVEAGSDRGAAKRDLADSLERRLDARDALTDLGRVAGEL